MSTSLRVVAIAAMAENRVIGAGNALPWHLPADMKWFRESTRGKTLLMGRKTYESIGRPLPKRRTLVLTRSSRAMDGVEVVGTVDEAMRLAMPSGELWICGGEQIYVQTLPLWNELFLTRVKRTVDGDAVFPRFEDRLRLKAVVLETPELRVERYVAIESTA